MNNKATLYSRLLLALFTGLLCLVGDVNSALANTLTASANKSDLEVNEILELKVVFDQEAVSDDLDASALEQDFIVTPPNFEVTKRKLGNEFVRQSTWSFSIAPRKAGYCVSPKFDTKRPRVGTDPVNRYP